MATNLNLNLRPSPMALGSYTHTAINSSDEGLIGPVPDDATIEGIVFSYCGVGQNSMSLEFALCDQPGVGFDDCQIKLQNAPLKFGILGVGGAGGVVRFGMHRKVNDGLRYLRYRVTELAGAASGADVVVWLEIRPPAN